MSYGQSRYEPMAYERRGRPLRPFNATQKIGVALNVAGALLALWWLADKAGLGMGAMPLPPIAFVMLSVLGSSLVGSRRAPSALADEEQRARNRKVLSITSAVLLAVAAAVIAIQFAGA